MGPLGKLKKMKGGQKPAGFLIPPCLHFGVTELPAGTHHESVPPDLLAAHSVAKPYPAVTTAPPINSAFLYWKGFYLSRYLCWASQTH